MYSILPSLMRMSNLQLPPSADVGMTMSAEEDVYGTWIPTILLALIFILRWILYGERAVNVRRWFNLQVSQELADKGNSWTLYDLLIFQAKQAVLCNHFREYKYVKDLGIVTRPGTRWVLAKAQIKSISARARLIQGVLSRFWDNARGYGYSN